MYFVRVCIKLYVRISLLYLLFYDLYKFVHCARTKQKAKIKNQRNY